MKKFRDKILKLLVSAFLALTIYVAFVPLNPSMPDNELESSWAFALNQANAQHLRFGKDIIFTFGPYSSVFTKSYHPFTDTLMLFGSFFFMTCFYCLLLYLIKSFEIWWQLLLAVFFASGFILLDAIFFLYLMLLVFATLKIVKNDTNKMKSPFNSGIIYLLFFAPLGLLMLIKGNFMIISIVILVMCMIVIWLQKRRVLSLGLLSFVIISTIVFWILSGQALKELPLYFFNSISMIGGYSEAMAWPGSFSEVAAYSITSFWILISCFKARNLNGVSKYFLLFSTSILLFLVFKSSFVRHDDYHAAIASSFIILLGLTTPMFLQKTYLNISLLLTLLTWGYIQGNHAGFKSIKNVPVAYKHFAKGFLLRVKGELSEQYDNKLALIRNEHPIPLMKGTTDIYSYRQAILLASGNRWQPRPVIQSYGAYTSKLAKANEDHIRSFSAPDNLIFRVETIDDRLPSLDDGISWPVMINNYTIGSKNDEFLFLNRKTYGSKLPEKVNIYCGNHRLGVDVSLSDYPEMLYVQLDIDQTIVGKFVSTIYKPQELEISVQLADGDQKKYRCIASMAKSGFILSPFIENTEEFESIYNNPDRLKNKTVKSFRISLKELGNKWNFWKDQYNVCVSRIILQK